MKNSTHLYKHVLIATDLSDHANVIIKRGVEIAKCSDANISIIHVLSHPPIAYAGEFSIPIDVEYSATLKKQADKQLAKIAKKYAIPTDSLHLADGSVKFAVTDLAKKIGADLIVVGTQGHEGIEALLGSQANAILHAAACDVWVIRVK